MREIFLNTIKAFAFLNILHFDPLLMLENNGIESLDIRIKAENFKFYDYTTNLNA